MSSTLAPFLFDLDSSEPKKPSEAVAQSGL